ncbi:uncharacterized protein [Venturia canescens]|uniref:uncharacterized protein n=1 Tax=Venturia canescens TaxID=32260 RepID=UPI001C9CD371|nr:uncharacterized protein LOC122413669 [Venturia canescens]
MKLLGLCLILFVTPFNRVHAESIAQDLPVRATDVKSQESRSTTEYPVSENHTTLTQDRIGLEAFEKLIDHLLSPDDAAVEGPDAGEGRTFGVKRLQFMLMPMMYKMGVMMTMLVVLTVISLKSLAIGVLLLVLKLAAFFGKFYAQSPGHGWSPPPQPVHLHVHNNGGGHHQPLHNGWESASGYGDDEHYYYKG